MEKIIQTIAGEFNIKPVQVENTVKLIDEGNTIPFIARYRKEVTGNLSDETLRDLGERLTYLRNLEKRKEEVIRLINFIDRIYKVFGLTYDIELSTRPEEKYIGSIYLDVVSVGATINAMLAAVKAKGLTVIEENDRYNAAIGIADYGDSKAIRNKVDEIVKLIKENKKPMTLDELDNKLDYEHPDYIKAVASISKLLATLNGVWGLSKWPSVNPKNIRDKIYVILEAKKEPMHFSEIAAEIKKSNFKRKNVTIQAIHNELIKDARFVLIGRGIYALSTWGYKKGTISEIIVGILEKSTEILSIIRLQ